MAGKAFRARRGGATESLLMAPLELVVIGGKATERDLISESRGGLDDLTLAGARRDEEFYTSVTCTPPGFCTTGALKTTVHSRYHVHGYKRLRAHPTTSVANRFCVLFVKRGIFASYGQRYWKTGHPANVVKQICEPSYWWARYKSNRIIWRWFAGGSHFSIGRPYHWCLGRRLCISERFANQICLQLCLNGEQTPKSGRWQTNTRCADDRTGVSRFDIHEHAVASGRRFRSRRRRRLWY